MTNGNTFAPERRSAPRLPASCDAEVTAGLAILDNDAGDSAGELVFFGQTTDVSESGIGIVLPSATIDERFCTDVHRLTVLLHLPKGSSKLQVVPSRCMAFQEGDTTRGYLLAGRIVASDERYTEYLTTLGTT